MKTIPTPQNPSKRSLSVIKKGPVTQETLKQQVLKTFKQECKKAVLNEDLKAFVYLNESLSDIIADQVCENGDDVDEEDWSELAELISQELEEKGIMDENHEINPKYFSDQ